jgi:hypothetical protein
MACEEEDDNGRFAHATIVRDHINSLLNRLLPAGSRGIPLFPHKFKAAPAVRVDQRGLAEVVQAYIASRELGAVTLPADVAALVKAELAHVSRSARADKRNLFSVLLKLNDPQLRGLHGTPPSSISSTGVQAWFCHGSPAADSGAAAAGSGGARGEEADVTRKRRDYADGKAGSYSLTKHVLTAVNEPVLWYANVYKADGTYAGRLLVCVTTITPDGRLVYHITGDPGAKNTFSITPPPGSASHVELARRAFGDGTSLPQRSYWTTPPLVSRHRTRRNWVSPDAKAAEGVLAVLGWERKATPEEALHVFASVFKNRAVIQSFWGSVSQRSRRLVAAARKRSTLHAFLKCLLGTADRNSVVFHAGNGFRTRRAQRGALAANVCSTLAFTARHMRNTSVNEYNSSKRCPVCHCGLMQYDKRRQGTCSNAACLAVLDRDVVGASNILRVVAQHLKDGSRPADLCPPRKDATQTAQLDENDEFVEASDVDRDSDSDSEQGARRPPAQRVTVRASFTVVRCSSVTCYRADELAGEAVPLPTQPHGRL